MAEVYPSDSALNALTSESETGIEYIPTGTAPYYLHFRKMIQRMLLSLKRGNDLRVFDESGLYIGVKAGKFWIGNQLVEYAGSSGNVLADDKANIYVYLDSSGSLVCDQYSDWPDMVAYPHLRLAVVTTSGGDITSITDARDHHSMSVPFVDYPTIEAHTADDSLTVAEHGTIHTNEGASGPVILNLPGSASAGTKFTFVVLSAYELRIEPGINAILDISGVTVGKYKYCSAAGSSITLVADSNGNWIVTAKNGTWTEEV